ncbi:DUF547 domain-containing protein [Muricauda sp. CAU 1633]|uniref:DUF547 domain-containing protein n=1 Tax=Allomuricauda sp. CAU 1633 TaxID=2816036 RepID=UPI001A8C01CB|nr:DUF547 domain-containing protein [Muricauda sp. CAU 1633]MBO0321413.1 DUF547 domain-containing protein [Muricauda sp. CAU 1633]
MNIVLHLLLGLFLLSCNGKKERLEAHYQMNTSKPSHEVWNTLLKNHVDENGNVKYSVFKQDAAQLNDYLSHLAQHPPSPTWSKEDSLAYYINLYNAATVKLIVDHYPVESIKDIPNRWDKKWIYVGNSTLSLNHIEHEILRKMNEPRIHFAINCASYSCPKLLNEAFMPEKMEQQLNQVAQDFVNDPTKNRFENGEAQLSKIFKWYKGDFTEDTSLLEFINPYLKNPIGSDADIDYLDYDWSLNDAK